MAVLDAKREKGEESDDTDEVDSPRDAADRKSERLLLRLPRIVTSFFVLGPCVANFLECSVAGPAKKTLNSIVDKVLKLDEFLVNGIGDIMEEVTGFVGRKRSYEEAEEDADEADGDLDGGDLGYFVPCRRNTPEGGEKDDENDGAGGFADFHIEIPP